MTVQKWERIQSPDYMNIYTVLEIMFEFMFIKVI